MSFKPKEVLVLLPKVMAFNDQQEAATLAANFNSFIHGKIHLKYEVLGMLNNQQVVLFYMKRDQESQQLRDQFMQMNLQEEQSLNLQPKKIIISDDKASW